MMKNYAESFEINHNPNWLYISDCLYRILIIGHSGSDKANVLLNSVKHQRLDIGNTYLFVKIPFKSKYQSLINGREKSGIKKLKSLKAFIDCSQKIDAVYENLVGYNLTKKRKVLIAFHDMITDAIANKQIKSYNHWIVFKRQKTQHFTWIYITILFQRA